MKSMKFAYNMFVVEDIEKAKEFYRKVFGFRVLADWGENVTFSGGFLALQTKRSWAEFIKKDVDDIKLHGNDTELYLTEEDFDGFVERLKSIDGIEYIHDVKEEEWGQKVIRFYDLDGHIIEVGEELYVLCRRLRDKGMSLEEIAKLTHLSEKYVNRLLIKADK